MRGVFRTKASTLGLLDNLSKDLHAKARTVVSASGSAKARAHVTATSVLMIAITKEQDDMMQLGMACVGSAKSERDEGV